MDQTAVAQGRSGLPEISRQLRIIAGRKRPSLSDACSLMRSAIELGAFHDQRFTLFRKRLAQGPSTEKGDADSFLDAMLALDELNLEPDWNHRPVPKDDTCFGNALILAAADLVESEHAEIVKRAKLSLIPRRVFGTVSREKIRQEFLARRPEADARTLGRPVIPATDDVGGTRRDTHDTKPDTPKKKQKREISANAIRAGKYVKDSLKHDPTGSRIGFVREFVEENGGSVGSIDRTLSDHPELWKSK